MWEPFPSGGGAWSLDIAQGQDEPALLLLAGGTGVTGWLPGLMRLAEQQSNATLWVCQNSWRLCCASAAIGEGGFESRYFSPTGKIAGHASERVFDEIRSR